MSTQDSVMKNSQIKKQHLQLYHEVQFDESTDNDYLKSSMSLKIDYNPIFIIIFFNSLAGGGFKSLLLYRYINSRRSFEENCSTPI